MSCVHMVKGGDGLTAFRRRTSELSGKELRKNRSVVSKPTLQKLGRRDLLCQHEVPSFVHQKTTHGGFQQGWYFLRYRDLTERLDKERLQAFIASVRRRWPKCFQMKRLFSPPRPLPNHRTCVPGVAETTTVFQGSSHAPTTRRPTLSVADVCVLPYEQRSERFHDPLQA